MAGNIQAMQTDLAAPTGSFVINGKRLSTISRYEVDGTGASWRESHGSVLTLLYRTVVTLDRDGLSLAAR